MMAEENNSEDGVLKPPAVHFPDPEDRELTVEELRDRAKSSQARLDALLKKSNVASSGRSISSGEAREKLQELLAKSGSQHGIATPKHRNDLLDSDEDHERTPPVVEPEASGEEAITHEYVVTAKPWDGGWELHIAGVGATQATDLDSAESMVRDYLELEGRSDAKTATVLIERAEEAEAVEVDGFPVAEEATEDRDAVAAFSAAAPGSLELGFPSDLEAVEKTAESEGEAGDLEREVDGDAAAEEDAAPSPERVERARDRLRRGPFLENLEEDSEARPGRRFGLGKKKSTADASTFDISEEDEPEDATLPGHVFRGTGLRDLGGELDKVVSENREANRKYEDSRQGYGVALKVLLAFSLLLFLVSLLVNGGQLNGTLNKEVEAIAASEVVEGKKVCTYEFTEKDVDYSFVSPDGCKAKDGEKISLWTNDSLNEYSLEDPAKERNLNLGLMVASGSFFLVILLWNLLAYRQSRPSKSN